jgi:hydroxypyruvate isomerase
MTDFELVANVSLLYKEVPLLDRFSAAADSGFAAVEMWWPFENAVPAARDIDDLLAAMMHAGVRLTGLNLFAGDMSNGSRGLVSRPDRQDEFDDNLDVVVDIAERTGCSAFNALFGQRQPGMTAKEQDETAILNLSKATSRLRAVGGTVLIEPLSRGLNGAYPLETASDGVAVVTAVREASGQDNISLLFDTFHLANNSEDLPSVLDTYHDVIGHVQLADTPGRGEPGSGDIDFETVISRLDHFGYQGLVACEYAPTISTADSLVWVESLPLLHLGSVA